MAVLCGALLPFIFLSTLVAQSTGFVISPAPMGDAPPAIQVSNAPPPPPGAVANNNNRRPPQKNPEQQRQQLLQKLTIDRTNSGILQARQEAKRLLEQEAKKAEEAKKNEGQAPPKPNPEEAPFVGPLTEQQQKQEEQRQKQQEIQKKIAQYQKDVKALRRHVTLGEWGKVKDYLESLPDNDANMAFDRIVQQLGAKTKVNPRPELAALGAPGHDQEQFIGVEEILALSDAAKKEPNKQALEKLAKLITKDNPPPRSFFAALRAGTRYFGLSDEKTRHRTAQFLINAKFLDEASEFLPDTSKAKEENNLASLNLISRFHAESHHADRGKEHLPKAWELCLTVISQKDAALNERGEALYRALALVPELEGEAGKDWLTKTFTDAGGEGYEILAAVGTLTSQTRNHNSADFRVEQLELQAAAVAALLGNDDIDLTPWREMLTLYARNWNAEAERTYQLDQSTSMRPQMQWDDYGNIYYTRERRNYTGPGTPPITAGDLLRNRPTDAWLAEIDALVRLENLERTAALFLKVKEEEKAFPILQTLVQERPKQAEDLVKNMIRVWADNNNPNQQSRYRSSYYYFYGSNPRAESIPLTRSKQERNLKKLAELITQVRALGLEDNFEEEFADAFIQAHSQAEVWRVEALESVFGPVEKLDPKTIAALLRRMRGNLANLWPNPKLQEQSKTKRKDKELQAQILHGYTAANDLCEKALATHAENWALQIQLASLHYEESNYRASLESYAEHSANKRTALDDLAAAAQTYLSQLPFEDKKDESTEPFTTWFYASLGSPDLAALKAHHQPVPSEYAKIKAALDTIPEECRKRHLDDFAKTLNSRLANVSPDLKYRFLEAVLPITGEHERIEDAAKVFQYYQDLITEIELDVRLDGPDTIDPTQPFGVYINIRHTKEIERESGGFQRYLVNQNNQPYAYNYGRPTEDYRDKFEKGATPVLEEHFEILSLTFHASKIQSRTDPEPGWRYTPYAYYLLKPKGPEVDTLPPLKIDLDFLDTSGYVVLPVTSAAIPIKASGDGAEARPYRDLQLTLTLDDREAEKKNLAYLEVRATAHGLVPPLERLVELPLEGFEITDTEDRDLQVEELTTDTDDGAPLSTHEWRLTLDPKGETLPATFHFPRVLAQVAEEDGLTLQKYEDVDLIAVEPTTKLTGGKAERSLMWLPFLALGVILIGGIATYVFVRKPEEDAVLAGPEIPQSLTPVTLLSFLDQVRKAVSFPSDKETELRTEIASVEKRAFSPQAAPPDQSELTEIAQKWQRLAAGGS